MADHHRVVLAGYDGSDFGRKAVEHAARLAGSGGKVVIVNARDVAPPTLTPRWRRVLDADHEAEGRAALEEIVREEGEDDLRGVTWETRLVPGEPAEALAQAARDVGADVIVVGSHGYGPVSALLGSVSHDLLRIADRPVMVVPPGATRAP